MPNYRIVVEEESQKEMPTVFVKDIKDIRNALVPTVVEQPVRVVCVAVHTDSAKNRETKIRLFKSLPIDGYVYNHLSDNYIFKCYESLDIGFVPVTYRVEMGGVGKWAVNIPMPEPVLKRYMTAGQRRSLAQFKAGHRDAGEGVEYHYLQMLSAYPHD